MSDTDPEADDTATDRRTQLPRTEKPEDAEAAEQHGRHELAPHQPQPAIGELQPRGFLRARPHSCSARWR